MLGRMCVAGCGFRSGCDGVRSPRVRSLIYDDNDVSNNREYGSLGATDILGIRYCDQLVRANGSNHCAVGVNLSTRIRIVWRRGKTNINRLLGNRPPETRTAHELTWCLPYEIVEMIIAHIARDLDVLKAFSLTCRSWYIVVVPRLHHTLTLRDKTPNITRDKLKPLAELHQLGLMPLVKEVRVEQQCNTLLAPWQAFSDHNLRHFSAFVNVQTLRLKYLDISLFIPGIERYFGHFSQTLRSIELNRPRCTPRQLSHFLSLFIPGLHRDSGTHTPTQQNHPRHRTRSVLYPEVANAAGGL